MQAVAHTKYIRTSPKKLREFARAAKGLRATEAVDRLRLAGNKAARLLAKSIQSAVANAKNGKNMDSASLVIGSIQIGKGPMLKRFQPVSRGMAHQIKKRTAHIKVILNSKVKSLKSKLKVN